MKRRHSLFALLPCLAVSLSSIAMAVPGDKPPVDKPVEKKPAEEKAPGKKPGDKPGGKETKPGEKDGKEGSAIIKEIVAKRKLGEWDLKVNDLTQKPGSTLPTASNEQYEVYRYAVNPQAADMFVYTIVLDRKTNDYWIVRSGGFAGQIVTFGPASYKAAAAPVPAPAKEKK